MKTIIAQLAWRVQNLQNSIKQDLKKSMESKSKKGKKGTQEADDEPPPVVDYIHKKEIKNLTKGAEDTSSASECDSDDMAERRKRRTGMTTSMERNMKRLFRATLKNKPDSSQKSSSKESEDDDILDKDGRIQFDRR